MSYEDEIVLREGVHVRGHVKKLFGQGWNPVSNIFTGLVYDVCSQETVKVFGKCFAEVVPGLKIDGIFNEVDEGRWGTEFKSWKICVDDRDEATLKAYFASETFKGIGEKIANKLVETYGTDAVDRLLADPDEVKHHCKLTDAQLETLCKGIESQSAADKLVMDFAGYEQPMTYKEAEHFAKAKGFSETYFVKDFAVNPYKYISGRVFPFERADFIAIHWFDMPWNNPYRMQYFVGKIFDEYYNKRKKLFVDTTDNADVELFFKLIWKNVPEYQEAYPNGFVGADALPLAQKCLKLVDEIAYDADKVHQHGNIDEKSLAKATDEYTNHLYVYEKSLYDNEQVILGAVKRRVALDAAELETVDSEAWKKVEAKAKKYLGQQRKNIGSNYDADQFAAVEKMLSHTLMCVTGGPGRGKTHMITMMAEAWRHLVSGVFKKQECQVIMLAPTGKAVNRIKQETGFENAVTIARCMVATEHFRLAAQDPKSDVPQIYRDQAKDVVVINAQHILNCPQTLVILDESSMISFSQAAQIFHLFDKSRIVFIGDPEQLPPIEDGAFFRDILQSSAVCVQELTTNHRTNSDVLIKNVREIHDGKSGFDFSDPSQFLFYPSANDKISESLVQQYQKYVGQGVDVRDMLVMSPVQKGAYGTQILNLVFQNLATPEIQVPDYRTLLQTDTKLYKKHKFVDERGWGIPNFQSMKTVPHFRVGDRVMNTKNQPDVTYTCYDNDDIDSDQRDMGAGIYNGDIGTILRWYQAGTYKDPRTGVSSQMSAAVLIQFDDGRVILMDPEDMFNWVFGYCVTVHKAQGSEASKILFAVPQFENRWTEEHMMTRNEVYTAVTRAKHSVYLVGNLDTMNAAVQRPYDYGAQDLDTKLMYWTANRTMKRQKEAENAVH